jgi:hypothetical protein
MSNDALIGSTGFVGGNLRRQHHFDHLFHSRNIGESAHRTFGTLVCAAAPGSMFEANNFPDRDQARLEDLCAQLGQVRADRFVLISSIAVLADFAGQDDETTATFQSELAYGRHRRALEVFCANTFENCLIVRLPALYGIGLKKNFLFDLLNPVPTMLTAARMNQAMDVLEPAVTAAVQGIYSLNAANGMFVLDRAALNRSGVRAAIEAGLAAHGLTAVQFTNPASTFQYYGLDRLWADIDTALAAGLPALHTATAPIQAARVHLAVTGRDMPDTAAPLHHEDMRTAHASLWQRDGPYLESADESLARISSFAATQKAAA